MSEGHTERLESALDGKYRIERKLGEGGMASVYLAEDIKHKRKVALKILRPELAAVIGAERFLTEITTTANLQHPHILPLFDSGAADGYLYYVMPFIDGETLGGKLEREKQLGVDEAVRIAREVADALDYAHRNGVIHRDIKPANILLQDGRPVVADFGIALAISAAGGGRMTETGLSLGTPHYMSPEQASADRDLSARSDIYSLGCVLYEMIAGQPPHTGPSAQSILVRILTESPKPLTELRHTVPPHISAVVAKAIEKLPADRFVSAKAFIDALDDTSFTYAPAAAKSAPAAATPSPMTARQPGPTWALAGVAAAVTALAGLFIGLQFAAPDSVPVQRSVFEHMVDTSLTATTGCCGSAQVVSRDGSRIAHLGRGGDGMQIFVRPLDQLRSQPVRGTEGARHPKFSYDGTWIAFNNANSLMKVPTEGGQPMTVAVGVGTIRGIAWLADNTIVYGVDGDGEGLYRVSADGGASERITVPDSATGERAHRYPNHLPGGSAILITVMPLDVSEVPRIDVLDLESGERKSLMRGADPWYTDDGHVVYALPDGSIMAQPFDAAALDTIGGPFRIAEGVIYRIEGAGEFGIALDGTMISNGSPAGVQSSLVLVGRLGGFERIPFEGNFRHPRFSPNGRLLAVERQGDSQGSTDDIWIYDLEQSNTSRLTVEGDNSFPSWSPDGETVMYQRDSPGPGLRQLRVDHTGTEQVVLEGDAFTGERSPDSDWLVWVTGHPGNRDIMIRAWEGNETARALLAESYDEGSPAISPNGRWMAYTSYVSGNAEVYVRSFPDMGPVTKISIDVGFEPRWRPDGEAIFYRSALGLHEVEVLEDTGGLVPGERTTVDATQYRVQGNATTWDVHPDGNRFVFVSVPSATRASYQIILNATTRPGGR